MNNQTFEQSVIDLLQHIQTILPTETWNLVEISKWNAVSMKFKNNDHGYVGKMPGADHWEWQDDGVKMLETHLEVRPATHLEKDLLKPKED